MVAIQCNIESIVSNSVNCDLQVRYISKNGLTTNLLVNAVIAVIRGAQDVTIQAATPLYAKKMRARLAEMCRMCGLDFQAEDDMDGTVFDT